jgi:predicted N-acetyltransferase YhbS
MTDNAPLTYKVATEPEEFEQIYELNYATFVDEIPQHQPSESRRLVDPLLERSTPYICLKGDRVVGMVAISGERPFSIDRKLPDLDSYLPQGARMCEIRLLAVRPDYRAGRVFIGLVRQLLKHCDEAGYDLAVFSATLRQEKLYLRAGCKPFGPLLGTPAAPYRGMYLTREMTTEPARRAFGLAGRQADAGGDNDPERT